jgi:DNA-binding GntR family transcriptional regulator
VADRSRYATVEDSIRRDILAGHFAFGQRLKIGELAERYGTSHMPIREALKLLSGEGLIEMRPNRGVRVRTVDATYISNLFDVRIQVESMQARLAAQRRTDEDMAALHAARIAFELQAKESDVPALLAANLRFHGIISKASGNPEAASIEARHWRLLPALWTTHGYPPERLPMVIDDHRLLEQLIANRDCEGAALLAGSHCLRAKLHILQVAFGASG